MARYEKDTHLISTAVTFLVGDLHEYDLTVGGVGINSVPRKILLMFDRAKNAKTPEARAREFQRLEDYLIKLEEKKKVDLKFDELCARMKVGYDDRDKLRKMVGYSGTSASSLISLFKAYQNAKENELERERRSSARDVEELKPEEKKPSNRPKTKSGIMKPRHVRHSERSFGYYGEAETVLKEMKYALKGEHSVNFSIDNYRVRDLLDKFVLLNRLLKDKETNPDQVKRLLVEQVCMFNDLRLKKCDENEAILLDIYRNFNPLKVLAKYEKKYPSADVREAINEKMVEKLDGLFGYSEFYGILKNNLDVIGLSHIVSTRTELMTPREIGGLYHRYAQKRDGWSNLETSKLQNTFAMAIRYNTEYDALLGEKATDEERLAENYMICAVYFGELPARFENRQELLDYICDNVSDKKAAERMINGVMSVENLRVTRIDPVTNQPVAGGGSKK